MIALAVSVFMKIYSINILYILGISNIHTHSHMYMSKESYYGHDFDVGAMNVIKCHILGGKKRSSVSSELSAARHVDVDVPGEYMDVKSDM